MATDILMGLVICMAVVSLFFVPLWWKAKAKMERQVDEERSWYSRGTEEPFQTYTGDRVPHVPNATAYQPKDPKLVLA